MEDAMPPAGRKPRHIGEAAEAVVRSVDWTHQRPGGNFCPSCGAGLGSRDDCHRCGWPDPEAARRRTEAVMAKKNMPPAPTASPTNDDPLRRVLMKVRNWLGDEVDLALLNACPLDGEGKPIREQMDGPSRPYIEEMEALLKEVKDALAV